MTSLTDPGPCILSNPDITGIGVRTAIYAQNLFSFIPAIFVLWDGTITYHELETIEQQSSTILITAFALLFSAIIQARTLGLSNIHATIILNLSWMNNTNLFIYLLVYVYRRIELRERIHGKWDIAKEVVKASKDRVFWIGSGHFVLMGGFGVWFWRQPGAFGNAASCALSGSVIILGQRTSLLSENLQHWSLLVYSFLLTPILNVAIPAVLFLTPILYHYHLTYKNHTLIRSDLALHHIRQLFIKPGIIFMLIVNVVFLIDTELALKENKNLLEQSDSSWTFGQTLALLLLLVPIRDFYDTLAERKGRRPYLMKEFVDASEKGNAEKVKRLLDEDPDGQSKDHAIMLAAANKHFAVIECLLDSRPGEITGGEKMAFLLASYQRQFNDVQWMAEQYALRGKDEKNVMSSLLSAAPDGLWDISKVLIDLLVGVKVNEEESEAALLTASSRKLKGCMDILLGLGVKGNLRGKEFLGLEFQIAHVYKSDENQQSPLHFAAMNGYSDIVKGLCKQSAAVNAKDSQQKTALHLASTNGHLDIVKILYEQGADIDAKDSYNRTALHLALINGCLDIAKVLCEQGADTNAQDNNSSTALHLASKNGHLDIAKILCKQGADININVKDGDNNTALHLASKNSHLDIVKVLCEQGADRNAMGEYNDTVLHLALKNGHSDIVKVLCEQGADINAKGYKNNTALHLASKDGHLDIVKVLCEQGADINAMGYKNNTALHLASIKGHLDIVKILCKQGADINAKDGENDTAIHLALRNGHLDIVKALCEQGADINAKGYANHTALHLASANGHLDIVKILFEQGADIHAKGITGNSALDLAKTNKHLDIVDFFAKRNSHT